MSATADHHFWDGIAESYSLKPVDDVPAWQAKLRVHKGLLRPLDRVLDVGCGTGSLCLELAPHCAEATGVDVSAEMVRIARTKADAAGEGHAGFVQGTLDDVELDGPFDVVSAYSLLHLVDDLDRTLAQLFDRTRPGGHFVSSTVVLGEGWMPYGPLLAVMGWLGKAPKTVKVLRRAHVLERIEAAGFVDVQTPDVGAKADILYVVARRPQSVG